MNDSRVEHVATVIQQAPVGQYLGADGARVLAEFAGAEKHLADRDWLFRKGEKAVTFYIVTSGRLAFVREATTKRPELVLHVLDKGDLVGELSFIDGSTYTVSCTALGEATVLSFDVGDLSPLIENHPRVLYDFMRAVILRVHQSRASILSQQQELSDYITTAGKRQ